LNNPFRLLSFSMLSLTGDSINERKVENGNSSIR
jgi:hypothetical protein